MEVVKVLRTLKASFFLSILLILPICFSFSPSTAYAAEAMLSQFLAQPKILI